MKKIKMATVYGECIKLKNKYYDTNSALNYANIHGGFTMKHVDYEQAAQECMKYFEDVLDEFDAVPVGIVLKGSEHLEN